MKLKDYMEYLKILQYRYGDDIEVCVMAKDTEEVIRSLPF